MVYYSIRLQISLRLQAVCPPSHLLLVRWQGMSYKTLYYIISTSSGVSEAGDLGEVFEIIRRKSCFSKRILANLRPIVTIFVTHCRILSHIVVRRQFGIFIIVTFPAKLIEQ